MSSVLKFELKVLIIHSYPLHCFKCQMGTASEFVMFEVKNNDSRQLMKFEDGLLRMNCHSNIIPMWLFYT